MKPYVEDFMWAKGTIALSENSFKYLCIWWQSNTFFDDYMYFDYVIF